MKRLVPILGLLALTSLTPSLFATTNSSSSTSVATKATATQRKDALDACKKDGKVGKQLNDCMKEKLSHASQPGSTAGN